MFLENVERYSQGSSGGGAVGAKHPQHGAPAGHAPGVEQAPTLVQGEATPASCGTARGSVTSSVEVRICARALVYSRDVRVCVCVCVDVRVSVYVDVDASVLAMAISAANAEAFSTVILPSALCSAPDQV